YLACRVITICQYQSRLIRTPDRVPRVPCSCPFPSSCQAVGHCEFVRVKVVAETCAITPVHELADDPTCLTPPCEPEHDASLFRDHLVVANKPRRLGSRDRDRCGALKLPGAAGDRERLVQGSGRVGIATPRPDQPQRRQRAGVWNRRALRI